MKAYDVKIGQLYLDNDKRANGRTLSVRSITNDGYAICGVGASGKSTKVRLDRFKPTSTGYKLLRDEFGQLVNE